jgi:hypothetical protein
MRNILIILIFSLTLASEPIAIVTKVRGKAFLQNNKQKLMVNSPLRSQDEIMVSSKSFLKLLFLDDGTSVNLFSETSVLLKGNVEDRKIQKHLTLYSGTVQVQVNPQLNGEFKLITNHSELTCDNCSFWASAPEEGEDKFYKIDNKAMVHNPSMVINRELKSDSTLFSIQGKDPYYQKTSVSEQKMFELLLMDAEESPSTEKQDMEITAPDSALVPIQNLLRIKLINAANIERELILTYTRE